jgi:large subunit ribosomal protein L7/L12
MSEIKSSKEVSEIKESIKKLNVGQVSELIEGLKEDYNIQETAIVQPTTTSQESEKSEEKGGNVSVKFIKMKEGLSAIAGYGAIKEAFKKLKDEEINILQAKKLTEKEDKIIFEEVARGKAEEIKKELAEKGIEVEIK